MKSSVVISTYNGSKYIEEQLYSIYNQTRSVDEVLIFDDLSTDNTVAIIRKFINRYHLKNWFLTINPTNKGWRRNFMEGLWNSSGDIVFTADQDDIWMPNKVEIMFNELETNPQIEVLVSNYQELFENGQIKEGPLHKDHRLHKMPLNKNYMSVDAPGCVYAIKRSIINQSKQYWRPSFGHDTLLWRMASLKGTLYSYGEELIKWRKHYDSAYSKETRHLKSRTEKIKWIDASIEFNNLMKKLPNADTPEISKILSKNQRWLQTRKKFYKTRNPFVGLKLFYYWSYYPRYRQLLGDWFLIIFNKYR